MPTFTGSAEKMVEEYLKATGQTANAPATQRPTFPNCRMEAPDDDISEKKFTAKVLTLAKDWGWRTAHFRPAWVGDKKRMITPVAGNGKGFLDLTLLRERLIVAELKCGKNKLTPEQKDWVEAWQRARIPVFVWYPHDWHEIVSILGAELCPLQN